MAQTRGTGNGSGGGKADPIDERVKAAQSFGKPGIRMKNGKYSSYQPSSYEAVKEWRTLNPNQGFRNTPKERAIENVVRAEARKSALAKKLKK